MHSKRGDNIKNPSNMHSLNLELHCLKSKPWTRANARAPRKTSYCIRALIRIHHTSTQINHTDNQSTDGVQKKKHPRHAQVTGDRVLSLPVPPRMCAPWWWRPNHWAHLRTSNPKRATGILAQKHMKLNLDVLISIGLSVFSKSTTENRFYYVTGRFVAPPMTHYWTKANR